ncbi:MAG: hypothetical protein DMF06_05155 [Verrucomicrobia bacterium]|nr:MAG: hypothetical protein DMF06_05155 [Verrucomicrobiota bacterium]
MTNLPQAATLSGRTYCAMINRLNKARRMRDMAAANRACRAANFCFRRHSAQAEAFAANVVAKAKAATDAELGARIAEMTATIRRLELEREAFRAEAGQRIGRELLNRTA